MFDTRDCPVLWSDVKPSLRCRRRREPSGWTIGQLAGAHRDSKTGSSFLRPPEAGLAPQGDGAMQEGPRPPLSNSATGQCYPTASLLDRNVGRTSRCPVARAQPLPSCLRTLYPRAGPISPGLKHRSPSAPLQGRRSRAVGPGGSAAAAAGASSLPIAPTQCSHHTGRPPSQLTNAAHIRRRY